MQVTEKNYSSASRKQQREFRKHQIIEATIDCIDQYGLSQTTLARIAEKSGLTQGNLVFHIRSKLDVLEQTLEFLNAEYHAYLEQAMSVADSDPIVQLKALIQAYFHPKVCNRRKISVWYSFWGESRSRPKYMQICGQSDRQVSVKILMLCKQMPMGQGSHPSATTAARTIECLMEGLCHDFLINAQASRSEALRTILELVDSFYPDPNNMR